MAREKLTDAEYQALAELRYRLRTFLAFSENEARSVGLEPRQHQLLLAIRGLPAGERPTIRTLADRLVLRHHSVVEMIDRLEAQEMVKREADPADGRVVLVRILPRGRAMLDRLSIAHRDELAKTAPKLLASLQTLVAS
ncbi:MAG: MarR family winged helix-turn-helix transcriptional regulator [Kofleriaceae bacterium]